MWEPDVWRQKQIWEWLLLLAPTLPSKVEARFLANLSAAKPCETQTPPGAGGTGRAGGAGGTGRRSWKSWKSWRNWRSWKEELSDGSPRIHEHRSPRMNPQTKERSNGMILMLAHKLEELEQLEELEEELEELAELEIPYARTIRR